MGSDGSKGKNNEILEGIKKGKEELFSEIVRTFKGKIFSIAYGFFQDRDEALDITQEVFLRLWKMMKSIEDKEIEAWIIKVTKNVCIDHYRSKRRETKEKVKFLSEIIKSGDGEKEFLKEMILRALKLIPQRQALAFSLRFFNGMKLSEISKIMEVSEGGAKSVLFKAINNIRKIIKENEKL